MGPKQRFLTGIAFIALSLVGSISPLFAGDEETYFVITAYYSPLPDQSKYTTGSYAGDIRLNGEGHTTASGQGVFPGLLAGPANYPFGTKIYFEGYGIGAIEDRGGAIVEAGERGHAYDRIDIWMGYGDEGLTRALTWGTRTIKGKIVVPSADVSLSFGESAIGSLTTLDVNPEDSDYNDVLELQEIFTKAELYNGEIDGDYESIKSELIEYQLKSGIIGSTNDDAAGWYGPKTIAALREDYGNNTSTLIEEPIEDFASYNHRAASEKYLIILEYGDLQVGPDSDSDTIKELQSLFTELGEYSGSIDGSYSSIEDVLIDLQKNIGLIDDKDDWGAGYFGNKTKTALWSYYELESDNSEDDNSNAYDLTNSEINTLDTAVSKLKENYSNDVISLLKSQINNIINDDRYKSHRNKLLYLSDIL